MTFESDGQAAAQRLQAARRRLREAREVAGLSRRALANRAGVQPSTVWECEVGQHTPNLSTFIRLLQAVGVDEFPI